jgi:hypothetical protein
VVDHNVEETTCAPIEGPQHHEQTMNITNQDEEEPDAQHTDDTIEQTTNAAAMSTLRPEDQWSEWIEAPTESPRPDVSPATPMSPSCMLTPSSQLFYLT